MFLLLVIIPWTRYFATCLAPTEKSVKLERRVDSDPNNIQVMIVSAQIHTINVIWSCRVWYLDLLQLQ